MLEVGTKIRGIEIGKRSKGWFVWTRCPYCGKERWVHEVDLKESSSVRCQGCSYGWYRGQNASNWKGGRYIDRLTGYVMLTLQPSDPFYCMAYDGEVAEHRYVMAQHLGRPLTKDEHVHHVDGVKISNGIENLRLTSRKRHTIEDQFTISELSNRVQQLEEQVRLHQVRVIQLEADLTLLRAQLEESHARE
jgi:ribosomal protein S27E